MTWLVDLLDRGALPRQSGRPAGRARPPVAAAVGLCLAWGLGIGLAAGAAAGATVLLPLIVQTPAAAGLAVIGAAWGMSFGVMVTAIPTALGTATVVGVLVRRHGSPADPASVRRDVARCFAGLLVALAVTGAALGLRDLAQKTEVDRVVVLTSLWLLAEAGLVAWVCVRLLRVAARSVALAWCRPWGWEDPQALAWDELRRGASG